MNDELFEKLLKIIYECSYNNKLVDSDFYSKVWFLFNDNILAKKYLNKLFLINRANEDDPKNKRYVEGLAGLFGQASYDSIEKNLVIYEDNLRRNNLNVVNRRELSDNDKVFFFNLLIMQTLLHEYEHVLQEIKRDNGDDYESFLLRTIYDSKPETVSSYNYSIFERLAEVNSYNTIIRMIEKMGIESQYVYNYFYEKLNGVLKYGYHFEDGEGYISSERTEIFVSPIETYTKMRGIDISTVSSLIGQVSSLDERIKYGMPVSIDEYNMKFNSSLRNISL